MIFRMTLRQCLLSLLVWFLPACQQSVMLTSPDLQTPVPSEASVPQATASPVLATSTSFHTTTPSVAVTRPPPTQARSGFPTVNPDAVATQAAESQGTRWAMTYPTAAGTPDPYNLIETAFANGEIDVDHASVYRLFALFASPGLPRRYSSPQLIQADGMGAFMFAMKEFDRLSPATQRFMAMFVTPREITIVPTAIHPSATPTAPFFPHGRYSTVVKTVAHAGGPPVVGRWEMDLQSPDEARFWLGASWLLRDSIDPEGIT